MKRATTRPEALLEALHGKKQVVIVTHDNPDPDAIGAALALRRLIEAQLGNEPIIAFGGIIGRAENRALVAELGIGLRPIGTVGFDDYDAVAMVDSQPEAGNQSLPPEIAPAVVIDHHKGDPAALQDVAFSDVRPDIGACSTMLVEYLRANEITIDARLATALFYGIKVDTQDLGRQASSADIDAYMFLFPLVDRAILPKIQYPPLPRDYFETFHTAVERAVGHGDVIVSALDEMATPNAVAEIADLLLRLEGMRWSIAAGFYEGQLYVSVRTADPEGKARHVVKTAIGRLGTAGGHGMMAGGRLDLSDATSGQRRRARDEVIGRFLRILDAERVRPVPLLGPRR